MFPDRRHGGGNVPSKIPANLLESLKKRAGLFLRRNFSYQPLVILHALAFVLTVGSEVNFRCGLSCLPAMLWRVPDRNRSASCCTTRPRLLYPVCPCFCRRPTPKPAGLPRWTFHLLPSPENLPALTQSATRTPKNFSPCLDLITLKSAHMAKEKEKSDAKAQARMQQKKSSDKQEADNDW